MNEKVVFFKLEDGAELATPSKEPTPHP